MRRVLYVITHSDVGGAQAYVEAVMRGLGDRYQAHLVTGNEGWLTDRVKGFAPITVLPQLKRGIRPGQDLQAHRALRDIVVESGADLVSAHSSKAGVLTGLACRRVKTPAVFTAHGWPLGRAFSPVSRVLYAGALHVAAGGWKHVVAVSRSEHEVARRWGLAFRVPVTVIPNGLPDRPWETDSERAGGPLRALTVCRIAPPKDLDTLLEALLLTPEVHLTVVGDGPERPRMERKAATLGLEGRAEFLGQRDDVDELLQASEVFCLSSRSEAMPLAIIEAIRAGRPVIATDVGGVAEIIDETCGFLVPAGSPRELAAALARLRDPDLRRSLSLGARLRFEHAFTIERMLAAIGEVYEAALSPRG